jgi:hypothetical protein
MVAVKLHNYFVQSYHKNANRNGLVNTIHNSVYAWFIYFLARKGQYKRKPRQVIKPYALIDKTVRWCRKAYCSLWTELFLLQQLSI